MPSVRVATCAASALTNANVASIDTHTEPDGYYFEIAFTYQKIKWEKDGVTFSDDWMSRV